MEDITDRQSFVPPHEGPNILPNLPLFGRLLNHASLRNNVCIKEVEATFSVSQLQLLTDVLWLRNALQASLDEESQKKLRNGHEYYIALLAPGGYEYTVGFLAIIACGAAVVPLSVAYPIEELSYFVRKATTRYMLVHHKSRDVAAGLQKHMSAIDTELTYLNLKDGLFRPLLSSSYIFISSDREPDSNSAGAVIFTSGTTGQPKGAVIRRGALGDGLQSVVDLYGIQPLDVVMHCLPVHHATGILITFLPFLIAGGCIEFHGKFDVQRTWERWFEGGLAYFSGVPTIYDRLMRFYEDEARQSSSASAKQFMEAAKNLKGMLCGTSALPGPLRNKWLRLTGKPILERYGATEFGVVYMIPLNGTSRIPDGSVGILVAGVDAKLSNGQDGEILVRRPHLLAKYLSDTYATRKAHDENGYFKTGDIGRIEGEHYFILGRSSVDILKSGGYKISALDIERAILSLDYITEAVVVVVKDAELGQRVAAAVVLRKTIALTIHQLRDDLSHRLARYKLPTVLLVVDELPKSHTGKIIKTQLRKDLFEETDQENVQIWQPPRRPQKASRL